MHVLYIVCRISWSKKIVMLMTAAVFNIVV